MTDFYYRRRIEICGGAHLSFPKVSYAHIRILRINLTAAIPLFAISTLRIGRSPPSAAQKVSILAFKGLSTDEATEGGSVPKSGELSGALGVVQEWDVGNEA